MLAIDTEIPQKLRQRFKKAYSATWPLVPDADTFYAVIKQVYFNNRLRTSAGRALQEKYCDAYWYIELNPKYYNAYGLERIVGTYLHELANVAAWLFYGEPGHSKNFKRFCEPFGGTINIGQGSRSPAANLTNKYLEATPKWRYTCPVCGQSCTRVRLIPAKKIQQAHCVKCQTPVKRFILKQLR